ncbi:hypothetical protein CSB69_1706 [Morganella morganii]|nr:hypothetical protein CSB69_1706 [Morganella morganii]
MCCHFSALNTRIRYAAQCTEREAEKSFHNSGVFAESGEKLSPGNKK